MKINIRAIIGLVLIVAVIYLALTAVMTTSAAGTQVAVDSSTGYVVVENSSDQPIQAAFTSARAFRVTIEGAEAEELTSAREGTGRNAVQLIQTELPAGDVVLRITRGSDVHFELTSEARITATAVPRAADDARTLLIVSGIIILGLAYYVSRAVNHSWLRRLPFGKSNTPATEPAGA